MPLYFFNYPDEAGRGQNGMPPDFIEGLHVM